ncbi:VanZ family protein [Flavobacteriales bacterium]|nr:VanZ family protein [Flavobacteriales bacterium]
MPGDKLSSSSFLSFKGADKLVHFTLYLVLLILIGKGLVSYFQSSYSRNRIIALSFLYCLFLGIGVEFIQSVFVAGRLGDFFDVLANAIGSSIGVLILLAQLKITPGKT